MLYIGLSIGLIAGLSMAPALHRLSTSDTWSLFTTVLENNMHLCVESVAAAFKLKATTKSA
jgi:hypothetical protein